MLVHCTACATEDHTIFMADYALSSLTNSLIKVAGFKVAGVLRACVQTVWEATHAHSAQTVINRTCKPDSDWT